MWGINAEGNLGQNNRTYRSSPIQVPGTTWKQACGNFSGIAAVKTDGTLWTWGRNNQGSLGNNQHNTQYSSPVQIPGTNWDQVGNNYDTKSAIKTDGSLWTWGDNNSGQLGQNQPEASDRSSPVQIPGTTWKYIASGTGLSFNLAIKTDGTLWGWGRNTSATLGTRESPYNVDGVSSPIQLPGSNYYYAMTQGHNAAALRGIAPPKSRYSSY
jgi:alpha-tubulin suppressor-like RCC1 family protein